ncbi:unnamed protein product [Paramecium pentaurelia]|uniref:Uncharacterized protein n=1 Tax=Paramecium pentaurelia TaxID=43138 RepID=A0A8S1UC87_9CILI|nr:unnamed protein product [Paramecium pentaurelia]
MMCQWYPQHRQCGYQNNIFYYYDNYNIIPLNQNQCYSYSSGEYHWSSNDYKVGECLKCSVDYPQRKKNQCTCEELIYQGDCALAGESCLWNSQLAQCIQIDCYMLKTRSSCISNYNCHWIQVDDVMQCLPMTKCSNLPGSNSYQCLAYSYRCTQSDGQFCQELSRLDQSNKCSSIQNYTSCYLTIGSDGVCAWNGQNCYALSECSQITQSNLCGINNYACQWNSDINKCISLNCENILTESACTYVDTTIDRHPSIQMCYWNNSRCANVTSISDTLTSSNCYINSGRTYSWSDNNSTKGHCESCSNDYLMRATTFIVLLLINY